MSTLYIHIKTLYAAEKILWNQEIDNDSKTVHELFQHEKIIDLQLLPAPQNNYNKTQITTSVIKPLLKEHIEDFTECHIILNTHGAAGVSDLSDEVVKEVVKLVSTKGLTITQISALQCNGLTYLTSAENHETNHIPVHGSAKDKPSSMHILQGKLNALETTTSQSFCIKGFKSAYDPSADQHKVINLLQGGSGAALFVTTRMVKKTTYQDLYQSIYTCRTTDTKSEKYQTATNELGIVLHKISENIRGYLMDNNELNPAGMKLYCVLFGEHGKSVPSVKEFDSKYKKWLKTFKMCSDERLSILTAYCDFQRESHSLSELDVVSLSELDVSSSSLLSELDVSSSSSPSELDASSRSSLSDSRSSLSDSRSSLSDSRSSLSELEASSSSLFRFFQSSGETTTENTSASDIKYNK